MAKTVGIAAKAEIMKNTFRGKDSNMQKVSLLNGNLQSQKEGTPYMKQ